MSGLTQIKIEKTDRHITEVYGEIILLKFPAKTGK